MSFMQTIFDRTFWWKHFKTYIDQIKQTNKMIHWISNTIQTCKHNRKLRNTNRCKHFDKIWTCSRKSKNATKIKIAKNNVVANVSSKFKYIFTCNATSRKRNINQLSKHFVRIKYTKKLNQKHANTIANCETNKSLQTFRQNLNI